MKLIRWVAEILADGSEIRSLSGRSAKLGDGYSRNPKERDELLQHRTKDLEGLSGQLKGFSLEEAGAPVAWAIGDDAIRMPAAVLGQTSARLNLQYPIDWLRQKFV